MRWMGYLGKLAAGAVLVSFLSVFTTAYLVDQYVQTMLQKWNLPELERPSLELGELLSGLTEPPAAANTSKEVLESPQEQQDMESAPAPPAGAVKAGTTPESQEEAVPVFDPIALGDSLVMSAEEFNEKRKNLTEADKLEIFSIMMKSLPQEELQRMSVLLEDGITEEEAKNVEDVINAYLHQDDVARLLSILNKY